MFKLYELTEMYNNIWDLVEDEDSDLEGLEQALGSIEESIEDKAENTAKLIKSIEGNINTLKEEEQRLSKKRRSMENKVKGIKEYLEFQLNFLEVDKVTTPLFTVAMQNNPQSVKFIDEDLIPQKYKEEVITTKIPKKAILDDLKQGIVVPGTEIVQSKSLRIR